MIALPASLSTCERSNKSRLQASHHQHHVSIYIQLNCLKTK
jgi:hypothetical protein